MQAKSERFELRLDPETLDKIDTWRSDQRDVPSRSEAVRKLINAGLGRPDHLQLLQTVRFNVLCAAITKGSAEALSDAYVYAWHEGVYPLFHESIQLQTPFAEQFAVPRNRVNELAEFLDDRWLNKSMPTFYKLEDHYDVRGGRGFWDRMKLIRTCRYMFLNEMFDQEFWEALLKGSDHPSEAKSITRKFHRPDDIYLA